MKFENQNGKLRQLWNKNKNNSSDLEALPTPIPKKLSGTKVNKYVQSLYTSEWEPTELILPATNTWEETWDSVIGSQADSVSFDFSGVQNDIDTGLDGLTLSVSADKTWNGGLNVFASGFGGANNTESSYSTQFNASKQYTGAIDKIFNISSDFTGTCARIIGNDNASVGGRCEAPESIPAMRSTDGESAYNVDSSTLIKVAGSHTFEKENDYNQFRCILGLAIKFKAHDSGSIYEIRYVTKHVDSTDVIQWTPNSPFILEVSWTSMERNFYTDLKNFMVGIGWTEEQVNSKSWRIESVGLTYYHRHTLVTSTSPETRTGTSSLDFTNEYIKFTTSGNAVAVFKYDLTSDEFALPEKLAPYVNIDVLSKLIDEDITSFDVGGYSAVFHYLKTKVLLIQTAELENGYYKYIAKATGAFFKRIEAPEDITDYPQVMMFVNFIRPEDYKQVNNHKFR